MSELITQLSEQKRKVDFDSFDITVKELVGMVEDGTVNIAPEYQRRFRWNLERQSALIESVFLGIPVPTLFMAANADGTWELIDGVQRLSTLILFIGEPALLEKIEAKTSLKLMRLSRLVRQTVKTLLAVRCHFIVPHPGTVLG